MDLVTNLLIAATGSHPSGMTHHEVASTGLSSTRSDAWGPLAWNAAKARTTRLLGCVPRVQGRSAVLSQHLVSGSAKDVLLRKHVAHE